MPIRIDNQSTTSTATSDDAILMETGDYLLQEIGDYILLDMPVGYYGEEYNATIVTGTYNVLLTDVVIVCNSTSNFTVMLPTTVVGQRFYIKNVNTGVVTVACTGVGTIDAETTQTVNQWDSMSVGCYAANKWAIL